MFLQSKEIRKKKENICGIGDGGIEYSQKTTTSVCIYTIIQFFMCNKNEKVIDFSVSVYSTFNIYINYENE